MNTWFGHQLSQNESKAIDALRFLCILSVVMLHSHVNKYVEGADLTLCRELNRAFYVFSPLPVLFMLSGYLFFYSIKEKYNFKRDYGRKLKSRIWSLLIPYLIWNTVGVLVTSLMNKGGIIHSFSDFLNCYWPLDPMGHPEGRAIWFIRNLMFFSIVSPIYFLIIKTFRHFTWVLIVGLVIIDLPVDYLYTNVYLLCGSYLGYYKFSLPKLMEKINWKWLGFIYILLMLVHVFGEVKIYFLDFIPFFVLYALLLKHPVPSKLCHSSMFIYVTHLYIVYAITQRYVEMLPSDLWAMALTMLLSFITTFLACFSAYWVMNKYVPRLLSLITGGR